VGDQIEVRIHVSVELDHCGLDGRVEPNVLGKVLRRQQQDAPHLRNFRGADVYVDGRNLVLAVQDCVVEKVVVRIDVETPDL